MDQSQDLQNKSVVPAREDGSAQEQSSPSAPAPSNDEVTEVKDDEEQLVSDVNADVAGLAEEVKADVEDEIQIATHNPGNLLTSTTAHVKELAHEVVGEVEALAHDAVALAHDAVDAAKEFVTGSDPDAEHDAALQAQYDATHALAAAGGDNAEGHANNQS